MKNFNLALTEPTGSTILTDTTVLLEGVVDTTDQNENASASWTASKDVTNLKALIAFTF